MHKIYEVDIITSLQMQNWSYVKKSSLGIYDNKNGEGHFLKWISNRWNFIYAFFVTFDKN